MDLVNVAKKLAELRQRQGLTIDQLATRSGLSKGYISQVENFRTGASIHALDKLSRALGIELAELFQTEDKTPQIVWGKVTNGEHIERNKSSLYGMSYFALAFNKPDRKLKPFFIEYRPGSEERELLHHKSDEFYVVLEGAVNYYAGSDSEYRQLSKGDTVYLGANIPHKVHLAPGCEFATALVIYS